MNSGAPNVPNLLSNIQTVEMYYGNEWSILGTFKINHPSFCSNFSDELQRYQCRTDMHFELSNKNVDIKVSAHNAFVEYR